MDYNGPERRTNWVTKQEFQELVIEVRTLSDNWKKHLDIYEEFLKTSLTEKLEKQELRKAITEKVVTGGVWATLIFLAMAAWDYLKTHVK